MSATRQQLARAGSSSASLQNGTAPQVGSVDFFSSAPTSITRVLTYTSPLVHLFSQFLSLLTWETANPSESFLLVAAWWSLCLFPRELIVYGAHVILVAWIALRWVEKGKRERLGKPPSAASSSLSQLELNKTVLEIQKISEKLSDFHALVNTVDSHLDWSTPTQTQIVVLSLLYSYPIWIVFNYFFSLTWFFLVSGTVLLVWNSPWLRVIRYSLMQSPFFREILGFTAGFVWGGRLQQQGKSFSFTALVRKAREQQKKLSTKKVAKDGSKTSTDLVFRFVLYENQRWWLGLDWTTNLFPNERPAWSDEYQEPTNNKNSFQLPAPSTSITESPEDPNIVIRKTDEWHWADADWWIDLEGDVDRDGWEYADNRWKGFSSKSGFRRYTRRRKWVRTAKLVETIEKLPNPEAEPQRLTNGETADGRSPNLNKPLPSIGLASSQENAADPDSGEHESSDQ